MGNVQTFEGLLHRNKVQDTQESVICAELAWVGDVYQRKHSIFAIAMERF